MATRGSFLVICLFWLIDDQATGECLGLWVDMCEGSVSSFFLNQVTELFTSCRFWIGMYEVQDVYVHILWVCVVVICPVSPNGIVLVSIFNVMEVFVCSFDQLLFCLPYCFFQIKDVGEFGYSVFHLSIK